MRIFKGRNLETTSTIIKLRDSKRVRIISENDAGKIKEKDFLTLQVKMELRYYEIILKI